MDIGADKAWSFEESLTMLSNGIDTMSAPHILDPARLLSEALGEASPDLMRDLLQTMINALFSADADAVAAAEEARPALTA